jgi:hypothetical protein
MKKIFLALVALFALATMSTGQGLIKLNLTDYASVPNVFNISDIKQVSNNGSGSALLFSNRTKWENVTQDLEFIDSASCNAFMVLTTTRGYDILVGKSHVKQIIRKGADTRLIMKDGTSDILVDEPFDTVMLQALVPVGCGSGGGGGATDLTYTAATTNGVVNSSTGMDATIPARTGTNAGLARPIPGLTALASSGINPAADYFEVWDEDAGVYKKILATFTTAGAISSYNVTITSGNSGSALRVTATGTGITASYASNLYTITVPAGVTILSANLIVVTADIQASADGGGFTDWVAVKFNDVDGNTGVTTLRTPQVQRVSIPTSGALATNNGASIDNDNNPASTVVGATTNDITIRFSGMSVGSQGYELGFNF